MADSKVQIEVTADTSDAKQKLADLEAQADRAMDSGANSARKFAKGLDEVGESAKLSAREIKGVVAGMASMAAGVASAALKANGREKEASYLGAASSGAVQGAGMFAPLGPAAMAAGAVGGAAIGAARNFFEREAQGREQAASMRELADSLEKARVKMDEAKSRADGFAGTLERLGDVSRSTADREAEREKEIARRREEIAAATERMAKAEEALRAQAATLDGPMDAEQRKAADGLKDAWAEANRELSAAQGELDRLKDAKVEAAKPAKTEPLDKRGEGPQVSAIEKLGARFGGAAQGEDRSDAIVGAVDGLAPAFADGADDVARAVDNAARDVAAAVQDSGSVDSAAAEVAQSVDGIEVDASPLQSAAAEVAQSVSPLGDAAQNLVAAAAPFGPAATALAGAASLLSDFGRATDALDREANRLASQQLDALRTIASKVGGGATFA